MLRRLEKDAVDWARILGGMKKYLAEYARSFAAAGFNKHKDLYIASGLLSYNASKEMTDMLKFLQPHSQTVQYKELYLPPEMLHSLNPEQQALVDFLVLANSDNFVGLGSSTFSVYLRCVDIGDAWIHKHSMLAFLQRPIGWWVGQGGAVLHGWLQLAPHVAVGKLSVDSTPKRAFLWAVLQPYRLASSKRPLTFILVSAVLLPLPL